MTTRYRAEQVGSLLRPPELLDARRAHDEGRLSAEQLQAAEDRAIADALRRQREIGLDILSDGEMRGGSWLTDMADAVEGFVNDRVELEWKGPGGGMEASTANAAGARLRKMRKLTAHETPFLKNTAGGPFTIMLPAPSNFMVSSTSRGSLIASTPIAPRSSTMSSESSEMRLSGSSRKAWRISSSTRRTIHTISIRASASGCGRKASIPTRSSSAESPATMPHSEGCRATTPRTRFTSAAVGLDDDLPI